MSTSQVEALYDESLIKDNFSEKAGTSPLRSPTSSLEVVSIKNLSYYRN